MKRFVFGLFLLFVTNVVIGLNQPVGVYWGFFDPPTIAHREVMLQSIDKLNLSQLIIVVNDHNDKKNSSISNFTRTKLIKDMLPINVLDKVTILSQDQDTPIGYFDLKENITEPLYVISGQDSFESWIKDKDLASLNKYDQIYVVPRNNLSLKDLPKHKKVVKLMLDNHLDYIEVSSSKIKNAKTLSDVKNMLPVNVWEFLHKGIAKSEGR